MSYRINEIFYSIQGEGARTGSANVFVRFAGCNLACNVQDHGFDCDTDFTGGMTMAASEIAEAVDSVGQGCTNVIWTGGEPALQLDNGLLDIFPRYYHSIETNGTHSVPSGVDWISASPKTAEHTLRCGDVDELRYVRGNLQALPKPQLNAKYFYVSPTFNPDGSPDMDAVTWCRKLVKENPTWRLSMQTHKLLTPMR